MTTFVCPMHPEVKQDTKGDCPICGMQLVDKTHLNTHAPSESSWKQYMPLLVIFIVLFLVTGLLTWKDMLTNTLLLSKSISYFMIGFFLTFSTFKLMDVKGFAEGYATYDLLAKRWFEYGYIYPFIELYFGISMILAPFSKGLLFAEFFIMAFSGVGVATKLLRHEKFTCACLGTFLKVPLTTITLIEDFGMALLALLLLIFIQTH